MGLSNGVKRFDKLSVACYNLVSPDGYFEKRPTLAWLRWAGTIIIIIGITLISLDHRQRFSDSYVVKYQDSGNASKPEIQKGNNF